jgi:Ni,Fe-hydrogenase III large subunit
MAVRKDGDDRLLEALLLDTNDATAEVLGTTVPRGTFEFPSVTQSLPAAHWAERQIGDLWGMYAVGHPRWKSLLLHEAWPPDLFPFVNSDDGLAKRSPYEFMVVEGRGVHEIPVGPIHAGIIEPGHFRFSCIGEVIANLEIRLGYQHRGVEARLAEVPWKIARHVAEAASTDTTAANALAHAEAVESLLGILPPPRAVALRAVALETERLASHLGDLGGLAGDIGFAQPSATFGKLRGAALGIAQAVSGNRFHRGFVCPGGLAWTVDDARIDLARTSLASLAPLVEEACDLLFSNAGALERMEGTGALPHHLATEFQMEGPAARASGCPFDARSTFPHAAFPNQALEIPTQSSGDVLARASIKRRESEASLALIASLLDAVPSGESSIELPDALPADSVAVGIVEAWRGALVHWVTTDGQGRVSRYVVRDPSFQNWTGLAIAVRNNLVADFPLINKSFGLSYSGNDL